MNNHILRITTLEEAKIIGFNSIPKWGEKNKSIIEANNIINKIHQRIESLIDVSFDSGKWIFMKHENGAVFPVIIPDGQRNYEGWEGLSMSASYMVIKELMSKDPLWESIYIPLSKAISIENLEITPFLVM